MILYFYDESGVFTHLETASIDPLESKLQGKDVWLMPPRCTEIEPELKDGFVPIWDGEKWTNLEDNRGKKYWLPEDKHDSEPREMTELGSLPENAMFEPPEITKEEIAEQRKQEIYARLNAIDAESLRPLRAIAQGTATEYDTEKLKALEDEAVALRQELASL